MNKVRDYPYNVVKAVEHWFLYNADGISEYEVSKMSPEEVLYYFLEWEGIIGYTNTIVNIFQAVEYDDCQI